MLFVLKLIQLLLIAFFYYEGFREAYYWDCLPQIEIEGRKAQKNIHLEFMFQRTIVAFAFAIPVIIDFSIENILFFIGICFVCPFVHLGAYYSTRNNLNPNNYPQRWLSNASESSTSELDSLIQEVEDSLEKKFKRQFKIFDKPFARILFLGTGIFLIIISLI